MTLEHQKFDQGKVRVDLVPREAVEAIGRVLGFGAKKYSPNSWREGIEFSRLYAATLRHLLAWGDLEDLDPESNENHLAHAMCNLAFLLTFIKEGKTNLDDRYKY
jgi:hypothetical protein